MLKFVLECVRLIKATAYQNCPNANWIVCLVLFQLAMHTLIFGSCQLLHLWQIVQQEQVLAECRGLLTVFIWQLNNSQHVFTSLISISSLCTQICREIISLTFRWSINMNNGVGPQHVLMFLILSNMD